MADINEAWISICEIFAPFLTTLNFTDEAKTELKRLWTTIPRQQFLNYRHHLFKILIAQPIDLKNTLTYNSEKAHYIITGDDMRKLFLEWRVEEMQQNIRIMHTSRNIH